MPDDGVPTIALNLDLAEAEALHKTVGISLGHLLSKMGRCSPGSHQHNQAVSDFQLLTGIQQELLGVLSEVNQYVE